MRGGAAMAVEEGVRGAVGPAAAAEDMAAEESTGAE